MSMHGTRVGFRWERDAAVAAVEARLFLRRPDPFPAERASRHPLHSRHGGRGHRCGEVCGRLLPSRERWSDGAMVWACTKAKAVVRPHHKPACRPRPPSASLATCSSSLAGRAGCQGRRRALQPTPRHGHPSRTCRDASSSMTHLAADSIPFRPLRTMHPRGAHVRRA